LITTRDVIDRAGMGHFFIHRTGHNIGQETHGNGAHMDNLETKEERLVMPRTCFSIEPGVYREDFGIRSEINAMSTLMPIQKCMLLAACKPKCCRF